MLLQVSGMKYTLLLLIGLVFSMSEKVFEQANNMKEPVSELLLEIIESDGTDVSIAKYRTLQQTASSKYDLSESVMNSLGYWLLNEKKEAAIAIFQLNSKSYPESINIWGSLGTEFFGQ